MRPQSAAEAALVETLCARLGVEHSILKLELNPGTAIQARARTARYATLGNWLGDKGLSALVTAHHADDQAETLLMRLMRGAGVRGLAAMRPVAVVPGYADFPLLRPLLGWRRIELREIVADAGIPFVDDPSNGDIRFERARIRAAMTTSDWLNIEALARSTAHLAEADAALEWAGDRIFAEVRWQGETIVWEPGAVPRALGMRVAERIVETLGRSAPRGAALARWYDALSQSRIATVAGVRGDGTNPVWKFTVAPPPGANLRRHWPDID